MHSFKVKLESPFETDVSGLSDIPVSGPFCD
jgi:hypothetical protein